MSAVISQFFILSPRGDKIIDKDYRYDVVRTTDEIFFRKFKFWDHAAGSIQSASQVGKKLAPAPPFFNVEGVNYSYLQRSGLIFVITTRHNCSASLLTEILQRIAKLLKDYLAVLNEDSLRKNFTLVYEVLDEVIDFGYIQETSTEKLRPYVFNEVEVTEQAAAAKPKPTWGSKLPLPGMGQKVKPPSSSNISVAEKSDKNEIYCDVLERISAVFTSANSRILSYIVDGQVVLKSFLAGSPALKLALNEDLMVGKENKRSYGAGVYLDDCNFHECVNYDNFETDRVLSFHPPDGEFSVMNYRVTSTEFSLPFKIEPYVETTSPYKIEVTLRIRSDFPAKVHAINTLIRFNVPKTSTNVNVEFGVGAQGQSHEYDQTGKSVKWAIKKFDGSTEQIMKARISLSSPAGPNIRKELGPISMDFEIPNHGISGLAIRYLKIEERSKSYNPAKWVRNITQAHSYTCRVV